MIRLFSLEGNKLYDWTLETGKFTVGRSTQGDLVISDSTVSRQHAEIEIVDENSIKLTDLGSHNGTTVNGYAIPDSAELHNADIISFGRVEFKLVIGEEEEPKSGTFSVAESDDDMKNATVLPIKEALQPLPAEIIDNPRVFQAISEMGRMLILPGSGEEMFDKALELLQGAIPTERVAVLLSQPGGQELSLAASRLSGRRPSGSFTISRTIVRELLNQKNAILISDPEADSRFAKQKSIVGSGIRSAMAVPLFDQEEVLGVLYVDTTNPLHRYTEDFLRVTATFGNILAAKITNHNLLKERQAKQVLEAELKVASQIQNQLLPAKLLDIENYSLSAFQAQCKAVGGDLYDVAELHDGRVLFLLADVSGKGMGAALLMSNVLAAFRIMYAAKDFCLLEAISQISRQLLKFSRPGDFVTLFICVLCPRTNTLQYINAGHNPPMVVRSDGKVEDLEASGVPIGTFDIPGWKEDIVEFGVGDLLFMFTDGISEATDEDGQMYEEERLQRFLLDSRDRSPRELTKAVLDEVNDFRGGAPQSDDITMIVLRRDR
ncbi:MAG: SpoIIE family protein phosphatase [Candidatus Zixiibacteriota bacterium]|nr:MAG: SpoIIE family protein phosphatase [candidate division Zixibacteria bacterium]